MSFNEKTMKERLPKETFKALKKTIDLGEPLSQEVASVVANAMKDWAIEKGATHFTHWFQPLTGATAEKHDSFINPTDDGQIIMELSGKELIKGEPDASSFPSGGLRATCEARGYTAWDPTSYAFVKDGTLCIPTAFCSYTGEALDKKTPLLRSMEAVSEQAVRVLRLFGNEDVTRVNTSVGAEQEYFLIDKEAFRKRKDLIYCGRTLFGSKPPKGQELDDHYFGALKQRVSDYMKDLDNELWKYGILAKTKHNEVAPAQHELAPIYTSTNLATDQNQLTMELMKKIALKHGMVCLLHEKPFDGINGSGKHNNWSLATNTGVNLLNPGDTPQDNAQFLLFLVAVIKAVDEYQDLMRMSVASPGNDHRLGANEAPPAVVSMFLGDELASVLEAIGKGEHYDGEQAVPMELGVSVLPKFSKDNTDRNRTSPFAFTGNKFEFRMLGSAQSVATPNTVLNTACAKVLSEFADQLEGAEDFNKELSKLIKDTYNAHKRIIFNGNGYDDAWIAEAEKRGLYNLKTTVDALEAYRNPKNIKLFEDFGVMTATESEARYEIGMENYSKMINIEAEAMLKMAKKEIIPAVSAYTANLSDAINSKKAAVEGVNCKPEEEIVKNLSELSAQFYDATNEMEKLVEQAESIGDVAEQARFYKDNVLPQMDKMREPADVIEYNADRDVWPYPTYGDLIFSVDE
jgi:glutamine synthetase